MEHKQFSLEVKGNGFTLCGGSNLIRLSVKSILPTPQKEKCYTAHYNSDTVTGWCEDARPFFSNIKETIEPCISRTPICEEINRVKYTGGLLGSRPILTTSKEFSNRKY